MSEERLNAVAWAAREMLEGTFATGEASAAGWRPRDEDYALVFTPDVADGMKLVYESMWEDPPELFARPGQSIVRVQAAWSQDLSDGAKARDFPAGYAQVVPHVRRDVPWVAFTFTEPGETAGMAYDGLVWLVGRWVWFPKPWRALDAWREYEAQSADA
jgi:hypothetical protein